MKHFLLLLAVLAVLPVQHATAQSARAQLVHVSPDPGLDTLDVYLDDSLFVEAFVYRSATAYFDIPAGQHEVSFAQAGSMAASDVFREFDIEIAGGQTYSLIAVGVGDPSTFAPNPDGLDTEFDLIVASGAHETNVASDRFNLRQIYVVPDMPTSDFLIGSIVDPGLKFGDIRDFDDVKPGTWSAYMRSSSNSTSPYVQLSFNSDDLAGLGVMAVISGLYYTGTGIDIEAFFVRPDGTTKPFETTTQTFRAQMIHASADPAVESVDVYLDGGPLFINLEYPGAKPFIDLPTGTHQIDVVRSGGAIEDGSLLSHRESSSTGDSKHLLLTGFALPDFWDPNPDGLDTDLKFLVADDAQETSAIPGRFYLRQVYTIPDMPTSDYLIGSFVGSGYQYGDIFEMEGVTTGPWTGRLRAAAKSTDPYAALWFDSSGLEDLGIVAVITGRFHTGEGIDIDAFFVSPDGSIYEHQDRTETYRAQVIHASPDPVAGPVDVYMDGGLLLQGLNYTEARAFIDLPAGKHQLDVVPFGTPIKDGSLLSHRESSKSGDSKYFVLAGVVDPAAWPSNPDGHDTAIAFYVAGDAPEGSADPEKLEHRYFYGVIDMPAIDLWVDTWDGKLFEDIGYCEFSPNRTFAATGVLTGSARISGSGRHEPALASVESDWGDLTGASFLEVITGTKENITWFYVTSNGGVGFPTVVTAAEDLGPEIPSEFAVTGNYPNPFNPSTTITFDLPQAASVHVEVFNATGRRLAETAETQYASGVGHAFHLDAATWGSGLYFYKVIANNVSSSWIGSGRMVLVK